VTAQRLAEGRQRGAVARQHREAAECVVEHEGVTLVLFGHDGAQWKELKKAPEYYE